LTLARATEVGLCGLLENWGFVLEAIANNHQALIGGVDLGWAKLITLVFG